MQSTSQRKNPVLFKGKLTSSLGKVIVMCDVEAGTGFVSNIFTRPKVDGSFRMISNLSTLNENVTYAHFKIGSLTSVLHMMSPGVFMASVDIKHAYYSVSIAGSY